MVLSGGMLLWPLVQRRLSKVKEIGTLNVTQLINRQNAVLLDVREPKEFDGRPAAQRRAHPAVGTGARGSELAKLTSRPVVAYCERGQRSRAAGGALAKLGFADIYHLNGGFRAGRTPGCRSARRVMRMTHADSAQSSAVMMYSTGVVPVLRPGGAAAARARASRRSRRSASTSSPRGAWR